jgi:hypothetical protein
MAQIWKYFLLKASRMIFLHGKLIKIVRKPEIPIAIGTESQEEAANKFQ